MPVEKFRSVEEMNAAPIRSVAQDGFERFVRHCARYQLISPRKYPSGVFRFRSLEEAQAARAEITAGRDIRHFGRTKAEVNEDSQPRTGNS